MTLLPTLEKVVKDIFTRKIEGNVTERRHYYSPSKEPITLYEIKGAEGDVYRGVKFGDHFDSPEVGDHVEMRLWRGVIGTITHEGNNGQLGAFVDAYLGRNMVDWSGIAGYKVVKSGKPQMDAAIF